jgi:hypothetical protein
MLSEKHLQLLRLLEVRQRRRLLGLPPLVAVPYVHLQPEGLNLVSNDPQAQSHDRKMAAAWCPCACEPRHTVCSLARVPGVP